MNNTKTTVALDAQGGDHGPSVTVPAALDALRKDQALSIVLCGRENEIKPFLDDVSDEITSRIRIEHAEKVIAGTDRPVGILRRGKGSSLWTALELTASGKASACISAGNTVALMTLGLKILGTLPGIRRPALMSYIPTSRGLTGMLDLGANVNVEAAQLVQFAVMGSVVRQSEDGLQNPSVGLLNVGHEDGKGHSVVREAHERLKTVPVNYSGFIEGHDIYEGKVDIAVCDGFAGNLILKASEGLAGMLIGEFRKALGSDWRAMAGAALARPALEQMLERLDPDKHNGAPLLGLKNVLIKSHGRAGRFATRQAILEAGVEARKNVPARIEATIKASELEITK